MNMTSYIIVLRSICSREIQKLRNNSSLSVHFKSSDRPTFTRAPYLYPEPKRPKVSPQAIKLGAMEFKRKRAYALSVAGFYLFLGGTEFAIILPTVWDYLQSLGADKEYWIGLVVSAYSLSAAIAGVIGGRLADKYESHTKSIVLVAVFIMTLGSFQYAVGYSIWNLLASRLVCGVGTAAAAAMIAHLCRATEPQDRTPILAILNATRQLGILAGPAFQLGLQKLNFRLWGWTVSPLNAPGLFLGIMWILFSVYTVFMFHDMTTEIIEMKRARDESDILVLPYEHAGSDADIGSLISASVTVPNSNPDNPLVSEIVASRRISLVDRFLDSLVIVGQTAADGEAVELDETPPVSTFQRYVDEFLTDTFVLLIGMTFTFFFSSIAIEAVIPVIMQDYFNYGVVENSLVYMAGGFESLLIFFLMAYVSRHVRDSTLLIVGTLLMILSQVWLLIAIPMFRLGHRDTVDLSIYLIGIFLLYIGYPIAATASFGLFSKSVSHEAQGLGQGVRRLSSYVGLIVGPIWGGATVHSAYVALGVPIAILLLNSIMFAFSYKALKRVEDQHIRQEPDNRSLISDSN